MKITKRLASGVAHKIPDDLRKALLTSKEIADAWNALTPLGRNEWICWTISVKKEATRKEHITRLLADIMKGKRRPCCWSGCAHR